MKQKLFSLYNRLKKSFVDEIADIVMHKGGEIFFEPHIRINLPDDDGSSQMYEEIDCLQYDEGENLIFAGLQTVEIDTTHRETHEYWLPLKDMSFDELYSIAERL